MITQLDPTPTLMSAMEAIHRRRAVRNFKNQQIDQATIHMLLDAATRAPTAVHEEPWAFVVVQNKKILNRLSDDVKELLISGNDAIHPLHGSHALHSFTIPEFNAFMPHPFLGSCQTNSRPMFHVEHWVR